MATYYYGGQAVIEGVMMRGRRSAAVALRAPAGGILVHEEPLKGRFYGSKVASWPFFRGVLLLWDMLVLGTRMMMYAANVSIEPLREEAEREKRAETAGEPQAPPAASSAPAVAASGAAAATPGAIVEANAGVAGGIGGAALIFTMLFSLAFAIGLFFLLPLGAVGLVQRWIGAGWVALIVEGLVRLAILTAYLALIGRLPSIQRVFQYHGAEHKAINAFESGDPLDAEHVRRASRVHTRCGTGFLLIVVVVSIVVFALVGHPPAPVLILSRILLVPVIAALAYELMRLGARFYRQPVVRALMAPSLALQGLTTREPDDGQIECAIVALERVLKSDGVAALHRVA
ncbi:MAG TPA: DUF1385 domain-containing protein [Ktedonobacterales bacterium]|nr:DUF1385 domain-containing protein [Ktedonobacterales bacterium]